MALSYAIQRAAVVRMEISISKMVADKYANALSKGNHLCDENYLYKDIAQNALAKESKDEVIHIKINH